MTERAHFVALHEEGLYSMTELCERFHISRRIGYKWLRRYREEGLAGLANRSRAPHTCPHKTRPEVEAALVRERERHPHWSAKKLLPYLRQRHPELELPAPSTGGEILKRHGLIDAQRRRRKPVHPGSSPLLTTTPHQVWTADFKGEFRLGNGEWCYPLTVSEAHTRYLLACHALPATTQAGAAPIFAQLFAEHGLPEAIRTDNGSPFASTALCGLSRLSVEWIRLGIQHQRITPGQPQQNGRHERMHRTLKAETARPPAANLARQQERFDTFREQFNHERPHEALGQTTPASGFAPSPHVLPTQLPVPEYPGHFELRQVKSGGEIRFRQRFLFLSEVLRGEQVGLEEVEDGIWSVYFYQLLLGRFDEREMRIH
jgi:transposase InsO family protein